MPEVRATYRLQLSPERPFAHARSLLDALAATGISHLSLSPFLTARPGTDHVTDVVDHTQVDPVLGGQEELEALADAARAVGLGLIGDVVPHHMGTGPQNPVWEAVLREGRSSEAARFVDVEWDAQLPGARDKLILGVLNGSYGDELAAGRLGVIEDPHGLRVSYGELTFPLNAESSGAVERSGRDRLRGTPGEPRTWTRMHSLLEQQHYRLVSWRAGRRLINYRRYLHIDELAAVRVEDPSVFEAIHRLMLDLVHDGVLDGLRVDHLDGLADPARYLERLRDEVGPRTWIVVDHMATPDQVLPDRWPVQGTTGYELLRTSLGLQIDPDGLAQLNVLAADHDGLAVTQGVTQATSRMLHTHLGTDLRRLVRVVWRACQDDMGVRDVDYRTLLDAVARLLTALPVPRTYVDPVTGEAEPTDADTVEVAVRLARAEGGSHIPPTVWRYLGELLAGRVRWSPDAAEAVTRFQQLSGPVWTLGRERRLFHTHHAMPAACELGCDPIAPVVGVDAAHRAIVDMPPEPRRTTTTHQTMHGEDVRMRLAALSGMSAEWTTVAADLLARTDAPDRALGLRLLAVATAVWPITDDGSAPLAEVLDVPDLVDRFVAHAVTLARFPAPLPSHGELDDRAAMALGGWARQLFDPAGAAARLRPIAIRGAEIGMAASLGQVLMRCTTPGVPDTHRGTERWDEALAGPDCRDPAALDDIIETLRRWDESPPDPAELWRRRRDGRVKQWVLTQALRARRDLADVLGPAGSYAPVQTVGRWAKNLLAYRRTAPDGGGQVVVVVPRLLGQVTDGGRFAPLGRIWADTEVVLGDGSQGWQDLIGGVTVEATAAVPAAVLFDDLPVALLHRTPRPPRTP